VLTRPTAAGRTGMTLVGAAILALTCGLVVGMHPADALLMSASAIGLIICILLPMRHLPALMLAITIVMPTLVFEGITASGQARAVLVVTVLALGRVLMRRPRLSVPGILPLAIGGAAALTIMTALIAASRPAAEIGTTSDLVRDLSFPAAAAIGFLGASYARREGRSFAIAYGMGTLAIVAALASVWYWAWRKSAVSPPAAGLFNQIAATSTFGSRSLFPFVEDSPNLGALMFVLMCAFAAPPLMLGPRRHAKVVGVLLVLVSLAAVLTTQSRTGLVAAAAAAIAYVLLAKRTGGRRSTAVVGLVIISGFAYYAFGTFPIERTGDDTLVARVHIWDQAWGAFLQDPLIGHGYDYSLSANFVERAHDGAVSQHQSTHSDILSHLVDGGLVGTAVFLALLGLMIAVARRSLADPEARLLGVGYTCMLVGLVVGGLDNTASQSASVVTFEWLTFGVAIGMCPHAVSGGRRHAFNRYRDRRRRARMTGVPSSIPSDGVLACAE
jgi:O-Antigen ligase